MDKSIVETLAARVSSIVTPSDASYDDARRVWNAIADKRPAVIVQASSVDEIVATVGVARESGALLAVRSGGHSGPGLSTCDGGILLDVSRINGVRVDPESRTAVVGGGALLGDLDRAAQEHQLATTAGVVSHTGVAGLTLGGGLGRLMRKHGLTIDNLLSVELVTASGDLVRASETENADLFWGLRGAGHNFGVATSFEFRLHPLGPNVMAGIAAYPLDRAAEAIAAYREWAPTLPDDIISGVQLATIQAMPFPEELHGSKAAVFISMHTSGDPADGAQLQPITSFGTPAFSAIIPLPYVMLQSMADDYFGWGHRSWVKGGYVAELSDGLIKQALEIREATDHPTSEIDFLQMGGAIARVPEDATAFTGRSAAFYVGIDNMWTDPADDAAGAAWTRDTYNALEPYMMSGNYVNTVDEAGVNAVRATYGAEKYERLVSLKRTWDPENVFRLNQNIVP